jgi:hypothetical protein
MMYGYCNNCGARIPREGDACCPLQTPDPFADVAAKIARRYNLDWRQQVELEGATSTLYEALYPAVPLEDFKEAVQSFIRDLDENVFYISDTIKKKGVDE